jgi:hypothetical protein
LGRGKETGRAKQAGGLVRLPGPGRREEELGAGGPVGPEGSGPGEEGGKVGWARGRVR